MKPSPTMILATAVLWIGTLIGAYQFGNRHTASAATDSMADAATAARRSSANGTHGESSGTARDRKRATDKTLTVKQIFAQIKSTARSGMMQNPTAMMHMMSMLDKLRPEDIGDALTEMDAIKDPQTKMMVSMFILGKWAERDGPAAMKYAEEHSKDPGISGKLMKMGVASAWAESDPEAVWAWYKGNKDNDSGDRFGGNQMVLSSVFSSLMANNPDAAFKRFDELDPGTRQAAFAGMCQSALMDEGKRQILLDKVNAMPDGSEKTSSRHILLSQWAAFAPDEATDWVAKQPAADQKSLRQGVGPALMMSDPKKGAAFMMEGVSTEDKPQRCSEVVSTWSMMDPKAAAAWLDTQGSGPELDQARQTLVSNMNHSNPEGAMKQAQAITDADKRFSAVSSAYGAWSKKDSSAAEQALQNVGLSAEQVQSIRSTHQ